MIVSEIGFAVMEFSDEFKNVTKLRNPFKIREKVARARIAFVNGGCSIRGTTQEEESLLPSDEEIQHYINEREKYVALRILEEYGHEKFMERAEMVNLASWAKEVVNACDGVEGQCSMFCNKYPCAAMML